MRAAAIKAHAAVSAQERIRDAARARPITDNPIWADDMVLAWKTNPPRTEGKWWEYNLMIFIIFTENYDYV